MLKEISRMPDSQLRKQMLACDDEINTLRGMRESVNYEGRTVVQKPLFGNDEWGIRSYHAALVTEYRKRTEY